jgi:hypothetical protein
MNKHITTLHIFSFIITIGTSIDSMHNNEAFLRKKESYKKSIEAKEYNSKILPSNNDIFKQIFSHITCNTQDILYVLASEDRGTLLENIYSQNYDKNPVITYYQIRTLLAIHHTCQRFHQLMPFKAIIQFCKTLPDSIKDKTLQRTIPNIDKNYSTYVWMSSPLFVPRIKDNYDNNLICLALIRAGANINIKYEINKNHLSVLSQSTPVVPFLMKAALRCKANPDEKDLQGNPIFFHAKTMEMAQSFIVRGCDIHAKNRNNDNILSYAIKKEYSADLMNLYVEYKVSQQNDLFRCLVNLVGDYYEANLMNEFLQKCDILLKSITNPSLWLKSIIRPIFSRLQNEFNELHSIYGDKENLKIFKKNTIKLFEKHGFFYTTYDSDFGKDSDDDLQAALHLSTIDLNKKEKINVQAQKNTKNALIDAVKSNDIEKILSVFKDGNIDINQQDTIGNTALIYATINKNNKIVRYLLDYAAKKDIANLIGLTAFDIAMDTGDNDLAELLMDIEDQIDM